jgi:hypothetical protein
MKIAFSDMFIGRRGSSVALYDLAHYNETILGNESIIISCDFDHEESAKAHPDALQKFKDRFEVFEIGLEPTGYTGFGKENLRYSNLEESDRVIKEQGVDALYLMKGCYSPHMSKLVPNLVHMLFVNEPGEYHGDRFAFISDWLADLCKERYGLVKDSVPWMVNIEHHEGDMREQLGIPKDAMVLGYHGGFGCFAVPYVGEPIWHALENRPDLHILLMNVDKAQSSIKFDHPRLKWLPGTADMKLKTQFINTCDGMLHARHHGETFGLSVGEFNRHNKPIIGCSTVGDRCHIEILGDSFIGYSNPNELYSILMTLTHEYIASRNWDKFSEKHNPEAVMKKFKEIFLDGLDKK